MSSIDPPKIQATADSHRGLVRKNERTNPATISANAVSKSVPMNATGPVNGTIAPLEAIPCFQSLTRMPRPKNAFGP